jgi:glycosyltransferase involved in cell wall biosynthesis
LKVIVFDVPAEHSGALSILEEYYNKAINDLNGVEWLFVVGKPNFKETNNVKVIRFPWIKKSWLHRLFFDYFTAPKLIKKFEADEVLSLQNITIPRSKKVKQTVYLHQALPFIDYKFGILEDRKMWIYQNIIGRIIKRSIKSADSVIVQTNWMKEACISETKESSEKFRVEPPMLDINVGKSFTLNEESRKNFFYPAGASYYKNHRILIDACNKLKENKVIDFNMILTLEGNENEHIIELYNIVVKEKLPVKFIGKISRKEVFEYYSKSILVFPSYIESSPLPLSEGKMHGTIIFASDCEFSQEILKGYSNAYFYDRKDSSKLAAYMKRFIERPIN